MFISKDDQERIALLNRLLGTKYREKPYDFANPKDVIEAAVHITAEYMDFSHYWGTLSEMNANFDESLEVFYPAAWTNITFNSTTNDEELDEAVDALGTAEGAMRALMDRAEEKCQWIWRIILLSDFKEVKENFFGENINFDKEKVEQVLEELFEITDRIDYQYNVEQSAAEFAKQLGAQCR